MIETIENMLMNVAKFSVIAIIVLGCYLAIGRILFYKIDSFIYISSSFAYLFNAALGQIDFTVFDQNSEENNING